MVRHCCDDQNGADRQTCPQLWTVFERSADYFTRRTAALSGANDAVLFH